MPTVVGGVSSLAELDALKVTISVRGSNEDFISLTFITRISLMPYMHISLSQEDTPCILLQVVDGELKDVAKGKILHPQNRMMHNMPMAPGVHRVQISLMISGYERVEPPIQPPGYDADEPAVLNDCFGQICVWPKNQMRLMTGEGAPHQGQRHRRSSCQRHMISSAHNKKMTMILMMISSPTSSSTLHLAMLTYS